jgi:hypothetical protein
MSIASLRTIFLVRRRQAFERIMIRSYADLDHAKGKDAKQFFGMKGNAPVTFLLFGEDHA